jgi:hypothetical protein
MEPTALGQADQAYQEIIALTTDLGAGDSLATEYALAIRDLVGASTTATRNALAEAARLHADNDMWPNAKARKVAAIPSTLADTSKFDAADQNVGAIAARLRAAILAHDPRNDAQLRWETDNHLAGKGKDDAYAALLTLATNTSFATFLAGSAGKSLAAHIDPAILEEKALEALAVNGTEDQIRRSDRLARIPEVLKAIGRARNAASMAASEVQRPPKPAPSQAMMR